MLKAPKRNDIDMIESASITSLMRYLLSNEKGLSKNPDFYGKYFVNGKWKSYLDNPAISRNELQAKLPGCIYYHLIRTKTFDSSLLKWLAHEKNSQIVILGTGFDSRAIRFKKELIESNATLYEVDLKAMLEHKQYIIEHIIGEKNLNFVKYVACNFHEDNVIEKLLEKGFSLYKPTLVLWEGVIYFLSSENIEEYLKLFNTNINDKLQITFDYAFRDYIEGNLDFYGAKELADILVELKEPHLFGLNYDEVENFFNKRNFSVKSNNTSFMLEALHIKDNYGNSVGKPHAFHGIAEIVKDVNSYNKINDEEK